MSAKPQREWHGMSQTPTYHVWENMVARCTRPAHPDYERYQGLLCDEWRSFATFYEDMGDKPNGLSIDRIDNEDGYCKANCRWATNRQQAVNKRNNHIIDGKTIVEWAESSGMKVSTFKSRIRLGWSLKKALATPARKYTK